MSSVKSQNVIFVLDRLKSALSIDTDSELASYLGVNQSTVANWRRRNTFDTDLIISKSKGVDLNWLFHYENNAFHNETIIDSKMYSKEPDFVDQKKVLSISEVSDTSSDDELVSQLIKENIELKAQVKLLKELLQETIQRK